MTAEQLFDSILLPDALLMDDYQVVFAETQIIIILR